MQFEENPTEDHKFGLVFEAVQDEPEVVGAVMRERIFGMVSEDKLEEVEEYEHRLSEWRSTQDRRLYTNNPMIMASLLEEFSDRTATAVKGIVKRSTEAPFDNGDISLRIKLGERALLLAGHITAKYDAEARERMLDEHGVGVFISVEDTPK